MTADLRSHQLLTQLTVPSTQIYSRTPQKWTLFSERFYAPAQRCPPDHRAKHEWWINALPYFRISPKNAFMASHERLSASAL